MFSVEEKIVKKIKRPFVYFCMVFTLSFFVVVLTPVPNWMASTLIVEPRVKKADVIVVFGGGAYKNGVLSSSTYERVFYGIELFKDELGDNLFFTGATVSSIADKASNLSGLSKDVSIHANEGSSMARIVEKLGIPKERLFFDDKATHTYANVVELKKYMDENKLNTCLLVSSPTHMYRVLRSAKRAGLDCSPAPVADYTPEVTSIIGRVKLFYLVSWEYAGLVFYKLKGYI